MYFFIWTGGSWGQPAIRDSSYSPKSSHPGLPSEVFSRWQAAEQQWRTAAPLSSTANFAQCKWFSCLQFICRVYLLMLETGWKALKTCFLDQLLTMIHVFLHKHKVFSVRMVLVTFTWEIFVLTFLTRFTCKYWDSFSFSWFLWSIEIGTKLASESWGS